MFEKKHNYHWWICNFLLCIFFLYTQSIKKTYLDSGDIALCFAFKSSATVVVVEDKERFDTTIGIPTNLVDGIYILQAAMLVGNGYSPYYSCGKLQITGGNPDLTNCQTDEEPVTYDCHKSAGPHIIGHFLHTGK